MWSIGSLIGKSYKANLHSVSQTLVDIGFFSSNAEAKKAIKQSAVNIFNPNSDIGYDITGKFIKLRDEEDGKIRMIAYLSDNLGSIKKSSVKAKDNDVLQFKGFDDEYWLMVGNRLHMVISEDTKLLIRDN